MARPASRRITSIAVLLPVLGLFLLMPPIITIFTGPRQVFGVPLVVAYLFGVWLFLVAVAAWLATRLDIAAQDTPPDMP